MAKDRLQVRPLAAPKAIVPQAAPVDTYRRAGGQPPAQGPTEMGQLFSALGRLQPTLLQIADVNHAEQTQERKSAGELKILSDKRLANRKALKEAVDRGEIPEARNPWFLQGMREQVFRLEGESYDTALREAYASSDAQTQDDISSFTAGFTAKYMKEKGFDPNEPEVQRILTPYVERSQASLLGHHRNVRDATIKQTVIDNTGREIDSLLGRINSGAPPEAYAAQIGDIVKNQYQNGLSGLESNKLVAETIARRAEAELNPAYFDLLDKIPSGSGTVGQIGYVKDIRRASEARIHNAIEERDRVAVVRNKKEEEAAVTTLQGQALLQIMNDPTEDTKEFERRLAVINPAKAREVASWRQTEMNNVGKVVENEEVLMDLEERVYGGEGNVQEIMEARRAGLINKETATTLIQNVEKSREFRSITNDRTVRDAAETVYKQIAGSEETIMDRPADRANARRAKATLYRLAATWKSKPENKDADELDLLDYLDTKSEQLMKRYAPSAVKAADESTQNLPVDRESVFLAPVGTVDWRRRALYKSTEEIDKDILEYRASQGRSGTLVDLAAHLGTTPKELIAVQRAFVARPQPKK